MTFLKKMAESGRVLNIISLLRKHYRINICRGYLKKFQVYKFEKYEERNV